MNDLTDITDQAHHFSMISPRIGANRAISRFLASGLHRSPFHPSDRPYARLSVPRLQGAGTAPTMIDQATHRLKPARQL
ncbi:hypothetical protein CD58_18080 [Pseudomonas brassicacearum]|nr:hypothetical protein CD58_18080 [Pseudomonas brassicacearum]